MGGPVKQLFYVPSAPDLTPTRICVSLSYKFCEAIAIVGFCFPFVHTPSRKCVGLYDVLLRIELSVVANRPKCVSSITRDGTMPRRVGTHKEQSEVDSAGGYEPLFPVLE